jgi:hypothetical protein
VNVPRGKRRIGSDIRGAVDRLVKFTAPGRGGDSIASEASGQLNVDGGIKLFATTGGGWVDLHPVSQIPALGGTVPVMTAWSAPHGAMSSPRFSATPPANLTWLSYHMPHGVNVEEGVLFHAHFIVDSASVTPVVLGWDYSYAHGFARGVYSTPANVQASLTPNGVAKTHYTVEIVAPLFVGSIETDGILKTRFQLVSGPDILVEICDAHIKLLGPCSENKTFPFGSPA